MDWTRRIFVATGLVGGLGAALGPAGMAVARSRPKRVGLSLDTGRAATMEVMAPARVRAVALFSHGHGSSPRAYAALYAALQDKGFAVLAPRHVDSMDHPERATFTRVQSFSERLADMRAASAWAAQTWPELAVAAVGHSFGTLTALCLGGALPDKGAFRDPRVRAVLGYSSPGRIPGLVTPDAYAGVDIPAMIMTGDADMVPGFFEDWRDHLFPIESAPAGNKYGLALEGVGHTQIVKPGPKQALMLREGMAFLGGYVLDASAGRDLLAHRPEGAVRWIVR